MRGASTGRGGQQRVPGTGTCGAESWRGLAGFSDVPSGCGGHTGVQGLVKSRRSWCHRSAINKQLGDSAPVMLTAKRAVIDPRPGQAGAAGASSPPAGPWVGRLTRNGRERVRPWQRGHGDKVTRMRSCLQHVKNDKQFGVPGAWLWPWGVPRAHRPSPDCGIRELGTVAPAAPPRPPPSASHPRGWELLPRQGGLCPRHPSAPRGGGGSPAHPGAPSSRAPFPYTQHSTTGIEGHREGRQPRPGPRVAIWWRSSRRQSGTEERGAFGWEEPRKSSWRKWHLAKPHKKGGVWGLREGGKGIPGGGDSVDSGLEGGWECVHI